jgi:hypothetical protein
MMKTSLLIPLLLPLLPLMVSANPQAPDLMPVTLHPAPKHAPLLLADEGKAHAALVLHGTPSNKLKTDMRNC